MSGDELDPEIAEEILDILQVHRNMVWSCEHLDITETALLDAIKFRGFDANNEPDYLGFAEFIQKKQDKFKEQPILNSHAPMLGMYRRRVARWKAKGKKNELSRADIEEIIAAGTKQSDPRNKLLKHRSDLMTTDFLVHYGDFGFGHPADTICHHSNSFSDSVRSLIKSFIKWGEQLAFRRING